MISSSAAFGSASIVSRRARWRITCRNGG
jgi:hypothetical protein